MTLILGIETSCDETAASIVEDGRFVRSNVVSTQHELHERYRGVVPEIASRAHLERITPVIEEAVREAGITLKNIDAIAVGNRPGLVGSLLVGVSAAKALAWSLDRPIIGIDHVQAHLYAASLYENESSPTEDLLYPALGLVISGGHTSLYHVDSPRHMKIIGRTIDDAIGEAYDKAAVILGLGYPGGPKLDKLAQTGDASQLHLPRTLLTKESLDFSFSGLKTALLYAVRGHPKGRGDKAVFERSLHDLTEKQRTDFAAAFQLCAADIIIEKMTRAIHALQSHTSRPRSIILGGGAGSRPPKRPPRSPVTISSSANSPTSISPSSQQHHSCFRASLVQLLRLDCHMAWPIRSPCAIDN